MASVLRIGFLVCILAFFGFGIYDYVANVEPNSCEMTYMFETPEYLKVKLKSQVKDKFPKYNLYLYGEGKYAQDVRSSKFRLSGIPVLFIPGNAGSYRQVRSLGSVALRMAESSSYNFHFNFFSLDLNEEFSALFGPLLSSQTEFAHACIKHILSMYSGSNAPSSVVVVGHSMGGMVARALYLQPDFDHKSVNTFITQATPHQQPVIALDSHLHHFYTTVNKYWADHSDEHGKLGDVTMFSTGGGFRDIMVRSGLTKLQGLIESDRSTSAVTVGVPKAWVSTDHLCHVWCKQTVLATVRAVFDIVDKNTKQIAVNPTYRVKPFSHHFERNVGTKQYKASHDIMINVPDTASFEIRKKNHWKFIKPSLSSGRCTAVHLSKADAVHYGFVAISNADNVAWVGGCSIKAGESKCTQVGNFARYANMIPPRDSSLKVLHLDSYKLDMFEYWAVLVPESKSKVLAMFDLYKLQDRNIVYNVTSFMDFFRNFPSRIYTSQTVINSTKSQYVFYNISLSGLTLPLQAYTANIVTKSCKANAAEGADSAVVKFFVPWSGEHSYTVIPRGESAKISLKLQNGKPEFYTRANAELHLYLMPACSYSVTVDIAWAELAGQFFRFYAAFLPAYIVMQILMALSWQLLALDEQEVAPGFVVSHARWAQPYRVCLVATVVRFLISYPEEDNFAVFIGLPSDDTKTMSEQHVWYAALPVLLYLFSYAMIGVYAHIAHFVVAGLARVFAPLCGRCNSSLFGKGQYLLLAAGLIASAVMCGTIGIILVYFIYIIKMLSSYVRAMKEKSNDDDSKLSKAKWNKFNFNFSIVLLLMMSVYLNAASLVVWMDGLSWGIVRLDVDPSRTSGVLLCIAAAFISYSDFPIVKNELTSIMGGISYICCVLMVLYATVSVYRVTYFINAVFMTIALPSLLLSFFSVKKEEEGKTKTE